MINAEVTKTGSENALSVIRKFSRRTQGAGIVKTVRAGRYHERSASKTVKKKRALKKIARRDTFRTLLKEGKVVEQAPRRGYGAPRATSPRESGSTGPAAPARFGESTPIAR